MYDVTEPEYGHEHNKHNILFIPANKPQQFMIRKPDNTNCYFFQKPIIHIYKNAIVPKSILSKIFQVI